MASTEIIVSSSSLARAAAVLRDAAADMQMGQPDLFLLEEAGAPRAHTDVAQAIRAFGEFAHDQYRDTVALVAALAMRVKVAAEGYQRADEAVAAKFLTGCTYQPVVS